MRILRIEHRKPVSLLLKCGINCSPFFLAVSAQKRKMEHVRMLQRISRLANAASIVIFSKTTCPYCKNAKDLLELEIPERFSEVKVVELDQTDGMQELQNALFTLTGRKTVPNIFINGHVR
jgi:glutaredoxin 3